MKIPPKHTNKFKKLTPEMFFLLSSTIVGLLLCLITPIGAGYDEDTHEARIWEISKGEFIPNRFLSTGPNFPSIFYELSYRQKYILEPIGLSFYRDNLTRKIDWDNMIYHETRSYYTPLLYLPQAFIMGLFGRIFDAPVLIILYLCRFSYLLIYIITIYYAIKIIPIGKWIFCILALTPMALTQSSIISADSITNAGSFLFIAYILNLRISQDKLQIHKLLGLIGIIVLLFSLKINVLVLILFLFIIPKSTFINKKQLIMFIFIVVALFGLLVIGWNSIALTQHGTYLEIEGVNTFGQIKYILNHPLDFISTVTSSYLTNGFEYLKEYIGMMGYRYWQFPSFTYPLVILIIILALFADADQQLSNHERIYLISIFIIGLIVTAAAMYVVMNPIGSSSIDGINGRYLIPIFPVLLIALIPKKNIIKDRVKKMVIALSPIISIIIVLAVIATYHIPCGFNYLTANHCYLPQYKNWEPDQNYLQPIKENKEYAQSFIAECSNMSQLRMWARGSDEASISSTNISIIDVKSGNVIANKIVEDKSVQESGWISMDFPVVGDSKNKEYLILIKSTAKDSNGISLYTSTRDEYTVGVFSENNVHFDFDLLFQYGCSNNFVGNLNNIID